MYMRYLLIISIALFFSSCSGPPNERSAVGNERAGIGSIPVDKNAVVSIGPHDATASSVLILKTAERSLNISDIKWIVNNNPDTTSNTLRFSSPDLRKGDVVYALVFGDDKEYRSNEIIIGNSPPVIRKAQLLPAMPTVSSRLTADTNADDTDGDYIAFDYKWTHNEKPAGDESYLEDDFKRGDTISVKITALDKEGPGSNVTLNTTIFNSLPQVSGGSHQFEGTTYTYRISASDPDGDTLTYNLEQGPEGMTIDSASGILSWQAGPDDRGTFDIKVSISDNNGGKVLVPITTELSLFK